jgi:eukaryotic-like serine/threonine-protein kinase
MPAKVTLTVKEGPDKGKVVVIKGRDSLTIGRGKDCCFRVPTTSLTKTVGRYHCQMEIIPPKVTVRDFGSLNGTYLNGKKIGRREVKMTAQEGRELLLNEFAMQDGDVLELGHGYKIAISVYKPKYCADCRSELPEDGKGQELIAKGRYLCVKCSATQNDDVTKVFSGNEVKCKICGKGLPVDLPPGEDICRVCMVDPEKLIKHLFENAKNGIGDAKMIAEYHKVKILGRGGMGEVWLVEEDKTEDLYALKLLLPQLSSNEKAKNYFLREAYNATRLIHPNVVTHYKRGHSEGIYFLLMEYCELDNVSTLMKQHGGRLPVKLAMKIILQALDGLDYAHNVDTTTTIDDGSVVPVKGLVHRDFTPHNIFLCGDPDNPVAKVGDYGLSKAFEYAGLVDGTTTGTIAGKPYFISRQQISNYKYSKPEVDIWSAAATLYHMLTGTYPKNFPGKVDPFHSALNSKSIPIKERQLGLEVHDELAAVIDKALDDSGDLYFQSAIEFKNELEKVL